MALDYGTLLGALFGSAASIYNNKSNIDLQKETNKANLLAQQEANALQVDLANTSHQREVLDLKAAGLNPILSAGGSGAATPSIGTATQIAGRTSSLSDDMRAIGRAASSAADADRRLKYQQIENLRSQDENLQAQNFNLEQDGRLKKAQANVAEIDGRIAEMKLRGMSLAESGTHSAVKAVNDKIDALLKAKDDREAARDDFDRAVREARSHFSDDNHDLRGAVVEEAIRRGVTPSQVDVDAVRRRLIEDRDRRNRQGRWSSRNPMLFVK